MQSTSGWLPIKYRDFFDVPRTWWVAWGNTTLLFSCIFDHALDEYPAEYVVRELEVPPDETSSWAGIESHARRVIGTIPVDSVVFDETRRREVSAESIRDFLRSVLVDDRST